MTVITIPSDLLVRAQALADAEGIPVAAFVIRCLDDVVTWMERTHAEIDAADVALMEPAKRQPKYGSGSTTLADLHREAAEGLMAYVSQSRPDEPREAKPDRGPSVAEMAKASFERMQQKP